MPIATTTETMRLAALTIAPTVRRFLICHYIQKSGDLPADHREEHRVDAERQGD
jgi:hypothetical protein